MKKKDYLCTQMKQVEDKTGIMKLIHQQLIESNEFGKQTGFPVKLEEGIPICLFEEHVLDGLCPDLQIYKHKYVCCNEQLTDMYVSIFGKEFDRKYKK